MCKIILRSVIGANGKGYEPGLPKSWHGLGTLRALALVGWRPGEPPLIICGNPTNLSLRLRGW